MMFNLAVACCAALAKLTLPQSVMRPLGCVFTTPGLHPTHHLPEQSETRSNYGDVFSFSERLFVTLSPALAGRVVFGLHPPTGTPD